MNIKTPVAFIIFNRPNTTAKVFEAIRQVKPPKLLVVADGPRLDRLGEAEKCQDTREVIQQVDWDCEVLTNYSDVNLGCKKRVASGLDWVFDNVEEAIIIEDDCLPHPTFFPFCEELLHKYRDDNRVMSISGDNFQFGKVRNKDSYYFSRYHHCWGWASWRRAWQYFDLEMKDWIKVRDEGLLKDIFCETSTVKYWTKQFQSTYEGKINSWAYIWIYNSWLQNGLTILPNVNLVSNIGFTADATHTKTENKFANMGVEAMLFPLKHPQFVICNKEADSFTQQQVYKQNLISMIKAKLEKVFS